MTRRRSEGSDTGEASRTAGESSGSNGSTPPVVAIVGRPNVGKSRLFNRLVGSRKAIVQDTPGVTRDRLSGLAEWEGATFELVDTGGLDPVATASSFERKIRSQIERAYRGADLLLFVVDGQVGDHPHDQEIARVLRKLSKPVVCAVNKIDAASHEANLYPYYRLGMEPILPVSAEHGLGLDALLDAVVQRLPPPLPVEAEEGGDRPIRVAVVGRPNVGKSTLVNKLLGEERQLVDEKPGTTRDAVDSLLRGKGRDFILIDTAGIRRKAKVTEPVERFSVVKALQSLERCDVALLLLDATVPLSEQDARIGSYVVEKGRGVVILLNKWDLVRSGDRKPEREARRIREGMPHLQFAPVVPVSARTGYGLSRALEAVRKVEKRYRARVPTGPLNRLLVEAVEAHPPPSAGRRIRRLKYVTQVQAGPPTFLVFMNTSGGVPVSYRRYLVNRLRGRFEFEGVPIRLLFRKKS